MNPRTIAALGLIALGIGAVLAGRPMFVVALLFAGLVVTMAPLFNRKAGAPEVRAPVAVPPEETEREEGPVTCCMRCGSPNVRQPRLSEGLIPGIGESLVWICARCKHKGQPLEFDNVTAYRQFLKGLQSGDEEERPAKPW